ncbi:Zn-dependent protease [Shewanella mangrovi]|uniref:Zn-dependent protease n=1 Tax=Shewanella mangrovi TaxID=1515746 RepID=A0A094K2U8_9GAMM|nr:site-2 protease family protein [Shewanella mangrovi]KFZ39006.1 Zn-dependent protease [Shewanella mangrovi]
MELLNIECLGKSLRLEGSLAGWQQLYWDEQLVSQKQQSTADGLRVHIFHLNRQGQEKPLEIRLETDVRWQPFLLDYRLLVDEEVVVSGQRNTQDIERQTPPRQEASSSKPKPLGILALGLKLFKSAKVIKIALAGASVAAYSWLFSFQFAIALILCLVIHEYGHIRAMKRFGLQTKGIYLIPFMGGLAVSDDKINTRWQNVVISIMGPTYGMLLSIIALVAYEITGLELLAGLAVFNALLNIFNLLPILPLDGGHILKSIGYSQNHLTGLVVCIAGAALGVYISYALGLTLLGILLAVGSLEILLEWKYRHQSHLLPMDRYGQFVSAVWYLLTVCVLAGIIWFLASNSDNPIMQIPLHILRG